MMLLVGIWLILCRFVPADRGDRGWVRWFVATSILLSLIGCLIAWLTAWATTPSRPRCCVIIGFAWPMSWSPWVPPWKRFVA